MECFLLHNLKVHNMVFLADENFPVPSYLYLLENGYDIKHIGIINASISDEEVIILAIQEERILLTFDAAVSIRVQKNSGANNVPQSTTTVSRLFPSPANAVVNLEIVSQQDAIARINITNRQGTVVKNLELFVFEGQNQIELDIEDLPEGIYFLQFISANTTNFFPFVKAIR